eukprot:gene40280-49811_t
MLEATNFIDDAEKKCRDANIGGDAQLAASLAEEEGYILNPSHTFSSMDAYYDDFDAEQEYYNALNTGDTTQQAVLEYFLLSFADQLRQVTNGGADITDREIEQALKAFDYDFDGCLKHLRESATSSIAPITTDARSEASVSYKSVAANKSATTSNKNIQTTTDTPRRPKYYSFREHRTYRAMSLHLFQYYLDVAKRKNPHMKFRLAQDGCEIQLLAVDNLDTLLTAERTADRGRILSGDTGGDIIVESKWFSFRIPQSISDHQTQPAIA